MKEQLMEVIKYKKEHNIIQECDENEKGYFMPFRAVVRKDKLSTQVRMMFNCSSCAKGNLSLNDCLDQGPNLNPSVLDIILGFQKFKIGFCGDIEKAFLMIGIAEDDKKYLKFLWYPDDDNEDFKVMQMNLVVFGCNCSPFLLSATIKYHTGNYSEMNKGCFEMLNGSLYVGDLCHGADDVESAFNLSSDAVSILSDASFNLRKLHTNSKQLHDLWIQNGLCEENSFEKDNKLKVLGLVWNLEEDMLRVDVTSLLESLKFLENTKRSVLSTVVMFDPVGFLPPFVVRIKRLMQEIWERGLYWDSKLPEDLESKWCAEIEVLGEVKLKRCYFSKVVEKMDSVEVHIFSDASIVAYGAVVYFGYVNLRGEVSTSFVMSKSRISPFKKLSLPRLELMGALIAARLWK
ncbi:reverse transcriptase [Caerostris darwini]|uniref:Reverse transcriptase n=1 Tax=Caerostris darwini TaxID=1538125 RepID=A0AAV4UAT1_9ARAC|nr:reverse transcriptase [Caerostris darwini]